MKLIFRVKRNYSDDAIESIEITAGKIDFMCVILYISVCNT